MRNRAVPSSVLEIALSVLLTILSLAFLYSVVRDLHQRYLIRCWIKAFTDANKAVQFLQEFSGVRLELGQLDAPMLPT